MKVLVTGHDGYIGTVLTPLLAAAGSTIRSYSSALRAPACMNPPTVTNYEG